MVQQTYTVDCKLENQTRYGAEMVSQSELAKQWIGTLVRPNSKLARLRVSSSDSSILMTEIKSLKELTKGMNIIRLWGVKKFSLLRAGTPYMYAKFIIGIVNQIIFLDGSAVDFKPDEALGNLYTLFSELKKLPTPTEGENGVGRYLIQHEPKTGAFVRAVKAVNANEEGQVASSNLYDAHMTYNMIRSNEDAKPPPAIARWLPIDVDLITPYHRQTQRVPGLFAPKQYRRPSDSEERFGGKHSQPQNRGGGGRGRRGKRGRKGGRN